MSQQTNYRQVTESGEQIDAFSVVKLSGGKVIKTTAITDLAFGILQDTATATDEAVSTQIAAITPVRVDGSGTAIAIGDELSPGAAGKAVKHDGVGTTVYLGRALQASAADDDTIEVLVYDRKTV